MDGEHDPIDVVEPEAPAIEAEVDSEPIDLDAPEAPEIEEQQPEDDGEEFDWNGQKVRGPKGLKDGVLMHADYTRKTQEVAASRRELEEMRTRIDQQSQATEEFLDARADLRQVQKELERFKGFGWAEYQQARLNDPLTADEAWNYFHHLQSEHTRLQGVVQQHETQRSSQAQQEFAKRMNETQKFAQENIPGWSADTDRQVVEFAKSKGLTQEQLAANMNPVVYEMLYLARIGAQTLSKPAAAAKPTQPQPQPLKVVASKANPPARKSLEDMDMDEYVAARRKQNGG